MNQNEHTDMQEATAIAVVGMAGRFPGAGSVEAFRRNLRQGVPSITFFGEGELEAAGVDPALLREPGYVRARGALEGADLFDAGFFGFSPREAEVMDPQHRVFLETAWEAMESAGYAPGTGRETVGIYAGSSSSGYLQRVMARADLVGAVGPLHAELANGKDFLVTRAAHKLDLRGPAMTVQTGCSTGLVAVHLACQALLSGECDLALAGGVAINGEQTRGYMHSAGGILSPDGHCRTFDAGAKGTVGGAGVALVALKRLSDARADGDTIHAVIRGSAVNNDGAQRVGFTAPAVEGQAAVIEEALTVAGVDPETIGYVEAHGSGTELGDPMEVAALTLAFGDTARKQFCALGSVKTNIGHLDTAAGAAGLIKAVMAVEDGQIPPSLNFSEPNPRIDFAGSPFFVPTEPRPWPAADGPRRGGVSSFGIGGTNAHVVLEQAPPAEPSAPARPWHLLTLSARTPEALEAATDRMAAHLRNHPEQALADAAYTLQVGRRAFAHRRVLAARSGDEAAAALESRAVERVFTSSAPRSDQPVTFLFPGLGSQYPGMGRGLYQAEPVYRETIDRCAEILRPHLGADLRDVLYPAGSGDSEDAPVGRIDLRAMLGRGEDPGAGLDRTGLAHPALFVTEYALAKLWMHWGVRPESMIGHSLGEYVAATVAGVWRLEDALVLAAERARLIDQLPEGGMMGLAVPEHEVTPYLRDGLCVGALNGPAITVLSGPVAAIDALQAEMAARGAAHRRLPVRHAFHSAMMEPVAERLMELLRGFRLQAPQIPFVSNVTGTWIRPGEAADPAYWARHLCSPVRFGPGMETLAAGDRRLMLEVGPGHGLRMLTVQMEVWGDTPPTVVASLRHGYERHPDTAHLLGAAGRLWAAGAPVDWQAVHAHERLRRVPLPTYPFERSRYWVDAPSAAAPRPAGDPQARKADPAEWVYLPAWSRAPLPRTAEIEAPAEWLVLADGAGVGARLARALEARGHTVALAEAGEALARVGEDRYTARPGSAADFAALGEMLNAAGTRPRRVVHLWGIDGEGDADGFARGYATVAALAAAFAGGAADGPFRLLVVTEGAQDVAGGEGVRPERASVLGACAALPQEYANAVCRTIDVARGADLAPLVDALLAEALSGAADPAVALRGPLRWVRGHQPARPAADPAALRTDGAYLFTGGLAGPGYVMAEHLSAAGASVAVVVSPDFPAPDAWDGVLASAHEADPAAKAIRWHRDAESRGGRPLLLRAAAGDAAALADAVAHTREAFGGVDGIVHAVRLGPVAWPVPLAQSATDETAAELARITRELDALRDATAGAALDFCLLHGSILPVLGAAEMAPFMAACSLADGYAQRVSARGGRWTSVAWDRWQEGEGDFAGIRAGAIRPDEGARLFQQVAALAGEPRIVVSTKDLAARIAGLRAPRASASSPTSSDAGDAGGAMHPRPAQSRPYHAPENPAEEILVDVWRELLGIREIGTHDDFFELGGHSLLGMRVISRVRDAFQVQLPLRAIFEAPTIAALAVVIDELILMELDEMTDEEAMAALGAGADGTFDIGAE